MADADELEESGGENAEEAQEPGFGMEVGEFLAARGAARRARRPKPKPSPPKRPGKGAAGGVASGALGLAGKGLGGPWLIALRWLSIPIIVISLIVIIASVAVYIWAAFGGGGSEPTVPSDPTEAADRNMIELALCLNTEPEGAAEDPAKRENISLSPECQAVVRRAVEDSRALVASLREQLGTIDDTGERSAAEALLAKIEEELAAIEDANGKYLPTKEHGLALIRLLNDPAISVFGVHPSVQRLINYVIAHPEEATQGEDNCADTVRTILTKAYRSVGGPEGGTGESLGPFPERARTDPPTPEDLAAARRILAQGDIPVWHINAKNSGQHWIALVKIEPSGMIHFYDPATGTIRKLPATTQETLDDGTPVAYFGITPLGPQSYERGYHYPAQSWRAESPAQGRALGYSCQRPS